MYAYMTYIHVSCMYMFMYYVLCVMYYISCIIINAYRIIGYRCDCATWWFIYNLIYYAFQAQRLKGLLLLHQALCVLIQNLVGCSICRSTCVLQHYVCKYVWCQTAPCHGAVFLCASPRQCAHIHTAHGNIAQNAF